MPLYLISIHLNLHCSPVRSTNDSACNRGLRTTVRS